MMGGSTRFVGRSIRNKRRATMMKNSSAAAAEAAGRTQTVRSTASSGDPGKDAKMRAASKKLYRAKSKVTKVLKKRARTNANKITPYYAVLLLMQLGCGVALLSYGVMWNPATIGLPAPDTFVTDAATGSMDAAFAKCADCCVSKTSVMSSDLNLMVVSTSEPGAASTSEDMNFCFPKDLSAGFPTIKVVNDGKDKYHSGYVSLTPLLAPSPPRKTRAHSQLFTTTSVYRLCVFCQGCIVNFVHVIYIILTAIPP